jgi:hypothetical protein
MIGRKLRIGSESYKLGMATVWVKFGIVKAMKPTGETG